MKVLSRHVVYRFNVKRTEYRVVEETCEENMLHTFTRYYVTICFPKAAPPKNRPVNIWGHFETTGECFRWILEAVTDLPRMHGILEQKKTKKAKRTKRGRKQ